MKYRDEGWEKHCERVGALAQRIGENLQLKAADLHALEDAARWHHSPVHLMNRSALSRLLQDIFEQPRIEIEPDAGRISSRARQTLLGFHGAKVSGEILKISEILTIADALDQEMELEPYAIPRGSSGLTESPFVATGIAHLRRASVKELQAVMPRLPVFPAAALSALRKLLCDDITLDEITEIGNSDPIYCTRLIGSANSARNNPRSAVRTVRQAVSYIGAPLARRVLLEATVQPLFTPQRMKPVWRHSVECAQVAAEIAKNTRAVPVAEAYLGGLIHDVGALAISLLNVDLVSAGDRLCELGCTQTSAEWVTFGFTHADASAEVLKTYGFAGDLIDAVEHHHAPERSQTLMSAVLYLAEFWSSSDEDLPSAARLQASLSKLRMTPAELRGIQIPM